MNWRKATLALVLCLAVVLTGCISKVVTVEDVSKYVQLGQYTGIEYTPVSTEVTDEQRAQAVEKILKNYAEGTDVYEGTVSEGDTINFNFTGLENGVKFENGSAENQTVVLGQGGYIPGFEEGIIGHEIGEVFTIDVTFPEDYYAADMAGKAVQFEILINYKTQYDLPDLTDEFVMSNLNSESTPLKSVEEFNTWIDAQLLASNESTAESARVGEIWQKVVDNCTFSELPQKDIDTYYNNLKAQYEAYAQYYSQMGGTEVTLETLVTQMFGISMEEFEAELTATARNTCEEMLAVEAIAYAEGMTVTDAELEAGAAEIATQNSLTNAQEAIDTFGKETIFMSLLQEKVLAFVCENAVAVQ